jgi:hypothetical protein
MMVLVMHFTGRHKGLDGILVAGGMAPDFTAAANTLIRLDVRTGGNLLQKNLHRLVALRAFEGQKTGWFVGHVDLPN